MAEGPWLSPNAPTTSAIFTFKSGDLTRWSWYDGATVRANARLPVDFDVVPTILTHDQAHLIRIALESILGGRCCRTVDPEIDGILYPKHPEHSILTQMGDQSAGVVMGVDTPYIAIRRKSEIVAVLFPRRVLR